jgi:transposase
MKANPDLAVLVEPMLIVRRALHAQVVILHRRLLAIVRDDAVCRRLMTVPGVGPVVALTNRATVDVPAGFLKSKAVGALFGLTCSKYQSGEVDRSGRISRRGDEMMRVSSTKQLRAWCDRTSVLPQRLDAADRQPAAGPLRQSPRYHVEVTIFSDMACCLSLAPLASSHRRAPDHSTRGHSLRRNERSSPSCWSAALR